MADLNKVMLSKLAWKVATEDSCLWVQLVRSKYLRNYNFWEVESSLHSFWWLKVILIWADVIWWEMVKIFWCG